VHWELVLTELESEPEIQKHHFAVESNKGDICG
jgi:hypothetical protein